ncbi:MAG: hypothetical protein ACPGSC_07005, partial [Granulosicoccaceae bacterium]
MNRACLLAVIAATLTGCGGDTETAETERPLRPVKVLEVNSGGKAGSRVLAGTIVSADSQDLSFRV